MGFFSKRKEKAKQKANIQYNFTTAAANDRLKRSSTMKPADPYDCRFRDVPHSEFDIQWDTPEEKRHALMQRDYRFLSTADQEAQDLWVIDIALKELNKRSTSGPDVWWRFDESSATSRGVWHGYISQSGDFLTDEDIATGSQSPTYETIPATGEPWFYLNCRRDELRCIYIPGS